VTGINVECYVTYVIYAVAALYVLNMYYETRHSVQT
jgi:hypothetical protein